MATIYREVEVEIDLSDIDTEDLVAELEERQENGAMTGNLNDLMQIYELRKLGKDYEHELDEFIYKHTGRF